LLLHGRTAGTVDTVSSTESKVPGRGLLWDRVLAGFWVYSGAWGLPMWQVET